MPAPRAWCRAIAEAADVEALLSVDLNDVFGFNLIPFVKVGMREAVERCGAEGKYGWLHVMPLLSKHSVVPDVSKCRDPAVFGAAAKVMIDKVAQAITRLEQLQQSEPEPEQEPQAESQETPAEPQRAKLLDLGLEWLRTLLYYSPNMASFRKLLDVPLIQERIDPMAGAIVRKATS